MTFLQNLWRDLVDKHLWPVAVVLVIAAVAVPFVIDSGSSTIPPPATATPASGVDTTGQVTEAVAGTGQQRSRAGLARDPFKPLVFARVAKTPAAASATGTPASAPTSTPATSTSSPGSSSSSAGTSGGGARPTTPAAPAATGRPTTSTTTTTTRRLLALELSLRIGRHGDLHSQRGLRPITYLPSRRFPLVSLAGFTSDNRRAVFSVFDDVVVSGKGLRCIPSPESCKLVEVGPHESVVLARLHKDGSPPTHFRLLVDAIRLKVQKSSTQVKASSLRSAQAPALAPEQWLEQVTHVTR